MATGGGGWGDTFGGILDSTKALAGNVADVIGQASQAISSSEKSLGTIESPKTGRANPDNYIPVWSDGVVTRQYARDLNRGTVATSGLFQPVSTFTANLSTTETLLIFVAAIAAGWAFTRFG